MTRRELCKKVCIGEYRIIAGTDSSGQLHWVRLEKFQRFGEYTEWLYLYQGQDKSAELAFDDLIIHNQ